MKGLLRTVASGSGVIASYNLLLWLTDNQSSHLDRLASSLVSLALFGVPFAILWWRDELSADREEDRVS